VHQSDRNSETQWQTIRLYMYDVKKLTLSKFRYKVVIAGSVWVGRNMWKMRMHPNMTLMRKTPSISVKNLQNLMDTGLFEADHVWSTKCVPEYNNNCFVSICQVAAAIGFVSFIGHHKYTCQMTSKPVEWFNQSARVWQMTTDRQTTLSRNVYLQAKNGLC